MRKYLFLVLMAMAVGAHADTTLPLSGHVYSPADWHPSFEQHQVMANELTAYLRQLMNW